MRIAIVCDWLTVSAGAERAISAFQAAFPTSPIFTTVWRKGQIGSLATSDIRVSRLQRLYRFVRHHQLLLALMPRAVEDLDLRDYDIILSSSHAVAKGVIPPSHAVHICYCHTPMRYAWEMEEQYLNDFRIPKMVRPWMRRRLAELRRWDLGTAKRVDVFLANSSTTAERISRIYGRKSMVIPPPVHERFFRNPVASRESRVAKSFLAVGRLVPYKKFDLLIEVANAMQLPLTIVGKGQDMERLKGLAGPTVTFAGFVDDEHLPALYQSASAVLFPPFEDAGIVPLEAQALGVPVIAYAKGGSLDTVIDGVTGIHFTEQSVEALKGAIERFRSTSWDHDAIRAHAKQFSQAGFQERIKKIVEEGYALFHAA